MGSAQPATSVAGPSFAGRSGHDGGTFAATPRRTAALRPLEPPTEPPQTKPRAASHCTALCSSPRGGSCLSATQLVQLKSVRILLQLEAARTIDVGVNAPAARGWPSSFSVEHLGRLPISHGSFPPRSLGCSCTLYTCMCPVQRVYRSWYALQYTLGCHQFHRYHSFLFFSARLACYDTHYWY